MIIIKGIFLDLDGTLINSEKAFSKCFIDVLNNRYNASVTKEDYKKYELEQNAMLINYIRSTSSILKNISDKDIMSLIYDNYIDYFIDIIKEKEAISNFEILRELKNQGYILALVTTCRRYYLDILNKELDIYHIFDSIIAREDVRYLKPNPEAYLLALEEANVDVIDSIAIEDSKRGIDAAIECGFKTIKVDNYTEIKYHDARTIEEESANKVLKRILYTGNYK